MVSFAPKNTRKLERSTPILDLTSQILLRKANLWYPSGDQGGSLDGGFFWKNEMKNGEYSMNITLSREKRHETS